MVCCLTVGPGLPLHLTIPCRDPALGSGRYAGEGVSPPASRRKKTRSASGAKPGSQGATTGYEAGLWAMADTLRGSMDAAEYKHVVLGPIFLKYISDAFEERRAAILEEWGEEAAEDRDEHLAERVFFDPDIFTDFPDLLSFHQTATQGPVASFTTAAFDESRHALRAAYPAGLLGTAVVASRGSRTRGSYRGSSTGCSPSTATRSSSSSKRPCSSWGSRHPSALPGQTPSGMLRHRIPGRSPADCARRGTRSGAGEPRRQVKRCGARGRLRAAAERDPRAAWAPAAWPQFWIICSSARLDAPPFEGIVAQVAHDRGPESEPPTKRGGRPGEEDLAAPETEAYYVPRHHFGRWPDYLPTTAP